MFVNRVCVAFYVAGLLYSPSFAVSLLSRPTDDGLDVCVLVDLLFTFIYMQFFIDV
jgi:hypothetical protein